MFCSIADLHNESDVEQKLLWPLLTGAWPGGLAFTPSDILTKPSIRRLEIGKGTTRRLYYPDYIIVLAGLPVLVIEAKAPPESLDSALDEARLYGNELNALFPSGINPCLRVVACNGHELVSAPIDTSTPDISLTHESLSPADTNFARFLELCGRPALQAYIDGIRREQRKTNYRRPVNLVGGDSFQNEELPQNTFGATIVGDYGHIFNPKTLEDRSFVVRHAYVPSLRRQRYVEPIDRLIRNAVTPATSQIPIIENSADPRELTQSLRDRKTLENQILLLVGSVGAGKSTFVDHLTQVALPADLRAQTIWLRVNLNEAPLFTQMAYGWLTQTIIQEFKAQFPAMDFNDVSTVEKVFSPEINAFKRGPIALLDPASEPYKTRLVDHILSLQADELKLARAMARFLCGGPGRLLVIVLDNCDKRTRDEQLTMFQVAQWVQNEFRSLVVLPIRDVTFDLHRHEPPLDTALKGLIFRIEPPLFSDVLQTRVHLALSEMKATSKTSGTFSYLLPNGIRVTYPASDQAVYLASILRSLYAHDRFVRQVMTGLAGRDVRRALEIFLEFCTSGHIGEADIYKIRLFEGRHVLPLSVVARVLLRMQRRFYSGDKSYIKNLVQIHTSDVLPDHFARLALLHWLDRNQRIKGPAGVEGFHRVEDALKLLVQLGHDVRRVREELLYLVQNGLIVPEHLRSDVVADQDLIRITASGTVHLQLMANPDYLAACAEDTWLSDPQVAQRIADRLTAGGVQGQFSRMTTARNAVELVDYLNARAGERLAAPDTYVEATAATELHTLREAEAAIAATEIEVSPEIYVGNIPFDATEAELREVLDGAGVKSERVMLPSDGASGKNRGFAFITLADGSAAMKALDIKGVRLRGRTLVLNEAFAAEGETPRRKGRDAEVDDEAVRVYVGNLAFATRQDHVREMFESHGLVVTDVVIPHDEKSRSKGFAFVTLQSPEAAERAMASLDGAMLDGRTLKVGPDTGRRRRR